MKNIVGYLFSENENDLVNLIQRIQKYIDRQNSTIESNKKYGTIQMYGGKWVENAIQAISRDILCFCMKNLS